ncbi:hypothetical protein Taro_025294, partial [Colocasia esculenta]|nr:hypothetical protein [Colocasia esculenta]
LLGTDGNRRLVVAGQDEIWAPPSHSLRVRGSYGSTVKATVPNAEYSVSCTTFNILAPIYKRLDKEVPSSLLSPSHYPFLFSAGGTFFFTVVVHEVEQFLMIPLFPFQIVRQQDQSCRESQYRADWLSRNQSILDRLLDERSSIICLQEVWVGNEELVEMYERTLGDSGYVSFKLARTNNRGDGLLTALHRDYFRVLNYRELLFNDFGDRVAQLLHVESIVPFWPSRNNCVQQEILIVYKILQYVESYQKEQKLNRIPIILCGDWNGSKRGRVYKFLRSQGFLSSYDTAHHYTDSDADAHKWVSHRNHRGNICGVDFIWLLNPNRYRKPLKTSWNEAVFSIIKYFLREASLTEENAFAFLKADSHGDYITYSSFCQALCELGLSRHPHGLSSEEIQDLWTQADVDRNGVVDYGEFQRRIWNQRCCTEQPEDTWREERIDDLEDTTENLSIGFNVKNAALFPPEAEKGMWPENYSLSDHAPLTVVFSPVPMPCSRPIC